jgi:hypothetical protein
MRKQFSGQLHFKSKYNFNYTSTRREKYLRYDVVQPAKEPHIKSTGWEKRKRGKPQPIYGSKHHIRDHPRLRSSTLYYKALQWITTTTCTVL